MVFLRFSLFPWFDAETSQDWAPKTSLAEAMESTMKVFIEKYADKLAGLKRASDATAPAAKKAK